MNFQRGHDLTLKFNFVFCTPKALLDFYSKWVVLNSAM